jgi:hypothetical protein
MQIKNPYFISFSLMLIIASCTKENVEDISIKTLYPRDYFPAYPGSYWKYIDSNNDTITYSTNPTYEKDCYTIADAEFTSDTFLVPVYNGIPVWGYKEKVGPISNAGSSPMQTILSDSLPVGSSWTIYYWGGVEVDRKVLAKDTMITIGSTNYSPTIVIGEYYNNYPVHKCIAKRYYTKNIGLVREDIFSITDTTVNSKLLYNCFIAH